MVLVKLISTSDDDFSAPYVRMSSQIGQIELNRAFGSRCSLYIPLSIDVSSTT